MDHWYEDDACRADFAPAMFPRQRLERTGEEVDEPVREDMQDLQRPSSFDVAINMFTSSGYFENPENDARVLGNLHSSLRAGRRLVAVAVK